MKLKSYISDYNKTCLASLRRCANVKVMGDGELSGDNTWESQNGYKVKYIVHGVHIVHGVQ